MLERIGPGLCAPEIDLAAVVARAAALDPGTELAAVLLDQRVAAGIGNVFKSEVCWAERVSPFTRLCDLDEQARTRIYETARSQLTANLASVAARDVRERPRRLRPCRAPLPALWRDGPERP